MSTRMGPESAGEAGTRAAAGPAIGISTLGDFVRWAGALSAAEPVGSLGGLSGKARAHEGRPDICVGPAGEKKSTVSPRAAPPTLSSTLRFAAARRSSTETLGVPSARCARTCCKPCNGVIFVAAVEGVPSLGLCARADEGAEDCARSCARLVGSTGKLPTELDGDDGTDAAGRHLGEAAADFGRNRSRASS